MDTRCDGFAKKPGLKLNPEFTQPPAAVVLAYV
jgi:hypothetical protein